MSSRAKRSYDLYCALSIFLTLLIIPFLSIFRRCLSAMNKSDLKDSFSQELMCSSLDYALQIIGLITWREIIALSLFLSVLYGSVVAFYRLYFAPVAAFPGPLLAGLTFFYQFYYDWVKSGQYYLKVEEMHKKYGKAVEITAV